MRAQLCDSCVHAFPAALLSPLPPHKPQKCCILGSGHPQLW